MTSRERVHAALEHRPFDRVPIENFLHEQIGMGTDIGHPEFRYGPGRSGGTPYKTGRYTDSWGCLWECAEDGVKGEVKKPLITEWEDMEDFEPPWDVLDQADLAQVNAQCAASDRFMVRMWQVEPFQRMQYVRGTEQLFMDFVEKEDALYALRDKIHAFHLREVEMWAQTDVDAIHFEDDWGTQEAMLVSPAFWREFFKPLYKEYIEIAHAHGKKALMHSDGNIAAILPDLIEIGLDSINAQLDCMDVESIARDCHGQLAFWGGFDRQYLLAFGSVEECRAEVRRIADAFFQYGRSGVIGQCFRDKGARLENVAAVYDEWLRQ